MKVGDLVKLKDITEVTDAHPQVPSGSVGLVMEWNPTRKTFNHNSRSFNALGEDGDGWVLWNGHRDWDIEYEEDLEQVINKC
jgi:hypothetical protein